jgi:hypothetical protein
MYVCMYVCMYVAQHIFVNQYYGKSNLQNFRLLLLFLRNHKSKQSHIGPKYAQSGNPEAYS